MIRRFALAPIAAVALACCPPTFQRVDVEAPASSPLASTQITLFHASGWHSQRWGSKASSVQVTLAGAPIEDAKEGEPDYELLRRGRVEAIAAPRGDGLALSIDGGDSYRYVAVARFDGGLAPMLCRHVSARSPEELFARFPTRRDFAFEVAAHPKAHVEVDRNGDRSRGAGELAWSIAEAVDSKDEALRRAVVDAWLTPDPTLDAALDDGGGQHPSRWLSRLVEASPPAREAVMRALGAPSPNVRGRAALALGWAPSLDAAEAIAARILADDGSDDGAPSPGRRGATAACEARAEATWALAHVLGARADAKEPIATSTRIRDALRKAASATCRDSDFAVSSMHANAIRGLACVHDVETLRAIAGTEKVTGIGEPSSDGWIETSTVPDRHWASAALSWIEGGRR